jgi:hydrogenase maturation protein HypF
MKIRRVFIKVEGIVQGVGFRPFVYNLAINNCLMGWVNNNSEGVFIDIEGSEDSIEAFIKEIKLNPPPLSRVGQITVEDKPYYGFIDFHIKESEQLYEKITLISPDISTCKECREDILNPENRRYFYPFTNCTNCGPRYSIIKHIPYDRDKTTMNEFKMCTQCESEYRNPLNRRFHAQPNACRSCGPNIYLTDHSGAEITLPELNSISANNVSSYNQIIIEWVQKKLKEGFIFVIKGLTGFHLVCDGENPAAVETLRRRKNRPNKPFAVMMKDLDTIKQYCSVNYKESKLLTGVRKPIVLLNKLKNYALSDTIAPAQNTLGVMLPFTPLHELLFLNEVKVLIMTSANIHGLPLEYENHTAVSQLGYIADFFLMHNRDIFMPVDDSVSRVLLDTERIIRRARGYAPEPMSFKGLQPILASGSNMKNTTAIVKEDFIFLSPHNGDLENIETFLHYKKNIEHLKNIFAFKPQYIAADMHPGYFSTQYAQQTGLPVLSVQHHHAHIVSCMAENNINHQIIGIAFDGTGYGTDGRIWGGEFILCDYGNFTRAAHLNYINMPGGESAIEEPWKMAVAYIYKSMAYNKALISQLYGSKADTIMKMIDKNINCIETSSMGRLFDAVSSILDICHKVSYEGQASMELEAVIESTDYNSVYVYDIKDEEYALIIDTKRLISDIVKDKRQGVEVSVISQRFHNTIIAFSLDICKALRKRYNINEVALSGGVFQNSYIFKGLSEVLLKHNFKVYTHSAVPTNDGGIALGQILIANEKIKSVDTRN